MRNVKPLYHILRIACAMCFIGHGAFGIITKQAWCNYFGVFGIGEAWAYQLMPVVGITDIAFGLLLLVYPIRVAAGWLIFWGLFTAMLRPLSGESVAEFLERAGNFGAPLVLLMFAFVGSSTSNYNWFQKMRPADTLDNDQMKLIVRSLQVVGCALLLGHGLLNLMDKPGLLKQYSAIGFENPETIAMIVGSVEVIGAAMVLLLPIRSIILVLFVWKVLSETQYPAYPVMEWVERGGSYGTLLALWFVLNDKSFAVHAFSITKRASDETTTIYEPKLN